MIEPITLRTNSPIKWQRRTAILLSARGCPNRATCRWHVCLYALASIRTIAFRGLTRSAVSWLMLPDIPLSCKVRELVLAPWKLARFVCGLTNEAAILEWRAK